MAAPETAPAEAHTLYETALALQAQGRQADAVRLLGQAAQSGHVPAMSLLGAQLLSGRGAPPDPIAGARLIALAAERGGGYASCLAAVLWASGLAGPPDWPRALDHLQRAAEVGFPPAQAQLRLLAGAFGAPSSPDDRWGRLRRAVDLRAWRTPTPAKVLSEDPLVRAFPGLLPRAVCDWIIARGKERLEPAQVYDAVVHGPVSDPSRRNSAAGFALVDMDLVLLLVRERLGAAAGLPVAHMQGPQVLHYAVGERFTEHYDFLDPAFEGHARDIAVRGQRVATLLVYLNDEMEGGETDFPLLGLRQRGARGDGLAFVNTDACGQPDRRTLHAGLPPRAGEKWLLSQWVRDRAPPGVGDSRVAAALRGR